MAVVSPTFIYGPLTTVTWASIGTSDTGDVIDISEYEDGLTFHNIGTGTPQLQRSNDGTNWVNWGSALTANSMNDQALTHARFLKIGSNAVATATVIMTGKKHRH